MILTAGRIAFAANWQGDDATFPDVWHTAANWDTEPDVPGTDLVGENVRFNAASPDTIDLNGTNVSVGQFRVDRRDLTFLDTGGPATVSATEFYNYQAWRVNFYPDLVISGRLYTQGKAAGSVYHGSVTTESIAMGQGTTTFQGPVIVTGANGLEVYYHSIAIGGGPTYVFNNTVTADGGSIASSDPTKPATLHAGHSNTLSGVNGTLNVNAHGVLNLVAGQSTLPRIEVNTFGVLRGDLTNATYGHGDLVGIGTNAVLAIAAGPEPTAAELGLSAGVKDAPAWYGIRDDGTFSYGDDGDSVYKGMAFGGFTAGGYAGKTLRAPAASGNLALLWLGGAPSSTSGSMTLDTLDETGVADIDCYAEMSFKGGVINNTPSAASVHTFNVTGRNAATAGIASFHNNFTVKDDQAFNFSGAGRVAVDPSNMKGALSFSDDTMYTAGTEPFAGKATYPRVRLAFNDGTALGIGSGDVLLLETLTFADQVEMNGTLVLALETTGSNNEGTTTPQFDIATSNNPNLIAFMTNATVTVYENNNNHADLMGEGLVIGDGRYLLCMPNKGMLHLRADAGGSAKIRAVEGAGAIGIGSLGAANRGMELLLPVDARGATILVNSTNVMKGATTGNVRREQAPNGRIWFGSVITNTPALHVLNGSAQFQSGVNIPPDMDLMVGAGTTVTMGTAVTVDVLRGEGQVVAASMLAFNTVAPGAGVGSIDLGAFTMANGSTYAWEVGEVTTPGTDYDVINGTTLTVDGEWTLDIRDAGLDENTVLDGSHVFTVVDAATVLGFNVANVTITGAGFDVSGASVFEDGGDIKLTGLRRDSSKGTLLQVR